MEWLVERAFVKCRSVDGTPNTMLVFRDPCPLSNGKTAWALAACCFALCPTIRAFGHKGIALSVYIWDRGCFSSCERILRKYHRNENANRIDPDKDLLACLDFVLAIADPLHDCGNAFEKGLAPYTNDAEMKDIYISVAAARNSYDVLMAHLTDWLPRVLHFTDEPKSPEFLSELWHLLIDDDVIVDVLVRLQVWWRGGKLHIGSSHQDDPLLISQLAFALTGVWKFVKFSSSRWLTLGPSAKAILASELTGISSLIDYVRTIPGTSDYYIKGHLRRGASGNKTCVIAALASAPSEAILAHIMQDDRVALHLAFLEDLALTELQHIDLISDDVFEHLSSITNARPIVLRSAVARAARTSVAFINYKIFAFARKPPFCFCVGEVKQNLIDMANGPQPIESISAQAWRLLRTGYPIEPLVELWDEIKNVPWSSNGVEQMHAGAAQVHKYHPEFEMESIACRSFMYLARPLFMPSEAAIVMERMQQKLDKYAGARCRFITGRHVYHRDAVATARLLLPPGGKLSPQLSKAIFARSNSEYRGLTAAQRAAYDLMALESGRRRIGELADTVRELETRIDIHEMRTAYESKTCNPWTVSNCRFDESAREDFRAFYKRACFSIRNVEKLRSTALCAPSIPSMDVRLEVMSHPLQSVEVPRAPNWVGLVCMQRDHFTSHALVRMMGDDRDGDQFFAFMWAYKSPYLIGLARLRRRATAVSSGPLSGFGVASLGAHWRYEFDIENSYLYTNDDGVNWDVGSLHVLPDVILLRDGIAVSAANTIPLGEYLDALPPMARGVGAGSGGALPKALSDQSKFIADHPWALKFVDEGLELLKREKKRRVGADDDEDSDVIDEELDAHPDLGEIDEIFAAMLVARDDAMSGDVRFFQTRPLGGIWTKKHMGVAFDAYQARAINQDVRDFCDSYGMQHTVRFDVGLYSNAGAITCCAYWCSKLNYFYTIWLENGDVRHVFGDAEVTAWPEPLAFTELAAALHAPAAQRRFAQLRLIRPELGVVHV